MDWLTQSQASKYFVSEETFEVEGDSVTMGGPKSAREAFEKGVGLILQNEFNVLKKNTFIVC